MGCIVMGKWFGDNMRQTHTNSSSTSCRLPAKDSTRLLFSRCPRHYSLEHFKPPSPAPGV